MEQAIVGIVAGVVGTLVMDLGNLIGARMGWLVPIDVPTIGRMAAGWINGRFVYDRPGDLVRVDNERTLGYLAHHGIGISLALVYVVGWPLLTGESITALGAIVYGIATTVASHFFVFPSLGLGVCGLRSPDGLKATFSSLANHFFFGLGMALVIGVA